MKEPRLVSNMEMLADRKVSAKVVRELMRTEGLLGEKDIPTTKAYQSGFAVVIAGRLFWNQNKWWRIAVKHIRLKKLQTESNRSKTTV